MNKIDIKSLKIKAILILVTVIMILAAFKVYADHDHYNQDVKDKEKFLLKQVKFIFADEIKRINDTLTTKIKRIARDKKVLEAFKNQDREKLYKSTKVYFAMMKEIFPDFSRMHFYLSDCTSFLRVHKPELYGDNLKEKRPMVTKAIETKEMQIGFASGVIKANQITYIVVLPIFADKVFLGALEFEVDFGQIVDKTKDLISKLYGTDIHMQYITKEQLIEHKDKHCKNSFFKQVIPKLDYTKKNAELNIDNKIYYIFWDEVFLKDYKKDDIGTIIYAFDITQIKKEYIDSLMSNQLKPLIAVILLIFIFNHLFNYINKSFQDQTNHMLQQSRMAQMGEMLSMIAHQWRQPLAAISATTSDLEMQMMLDTYDKEGFTEGIQNISSYSQHLSSTIDDFRGFFKENKAAVDITPEELIYSTTKIIGSALKMKNIKLSIQIESNDTINTIANEFKQVLLNLIKNAEDVLLEKNIKDPVINIKSQKRDNKIYFIVSDNGGGIPKEIIDKIFDPYFTTKDKKDGTGLGLYMSRTIIEEHCNGRLSVRNGEEGAVFEVCAPLSKKNTNN